MEIIILLIAISLSIAILAETLGIWGRVQGAYNDEPTAGYSTHVRIATIGRFFILLSAPSLGYLVDSNVLSKDIALIGVIVFLNIFISIFIFKKYLLNSFEKVYKFLNQNKEIKKINLNYLAEIKIEKSFFIIVFISFLLTATGTILVNYLASIYIEYRATIVQMSAVITMFGTIIHVFFIDPLLSRAADKNRDKLLSLTLSFLYARQLSSFILVLLFLVLYFNG